MLTDAEIAVHPDRVASAKATWANLTGPGPTLTSGERHIVIRAARAAWQGATAPDAAAGLLGEAAHWLAVDAEGLSGDIVADFEARGLDRWRYLETVGVVARLANVDFYVRGVGASLFEITEPADHPATGNTVADATITDGWVPALGPLWAPACLDALPDERSDLHQLHGSMYLGMADMRNNDYADVLHRSQMEYLAARTSYLNECFY